jgi:hypothetical protein
VSTRIGPDGAGENEHHIVILLIQLRTPHHVARKLGDELGRVEVEPERPRFDGFGAIHVQVQRCGATDRALTFDLDAPVCQTEYEMLRPAIHARVEDAHRDIGLRIMQLEPGELCAIAVPARQRQVGQIVASASRTR